MNNWQNSQASATEKSELRQRVSTALLISAVFVAAIVLGMAWQKARWILILLGAGVNFMCAWEFAGICSAQQLEPVARGVKRNLYFLIGFFPTLCLLVLQLAAPGFDLFAFSRLELFGSIAALSFLSGLMAVLTALALGRNDLQVAAASLGELAVACLLVAFGGSLLLGLAFMQQGLSTLLWLVAVVAANDISAYFIGSKLQGPKLASALSPAKTVSGALAGLAAGILVGSVFYWLLCMTVSWLSLFALLVLLLLAAQLGDLLKSLIKRLHAVKDSGTILPGHGGILDRVDGLLLACPVLYFWLLFG